MAVVYKPYQRGIYCDDESIKYPLKPDTITHGMLAAVTISCTVVIVSVAGFFYFSSHALAFDTVKIQMVEQLQGMTHLTTSCAVFLIHTFRK